MKSAYRSRICDHRSTGFSATTPKESDDMDLRMAGRTGPVGRLARLGLAIVFALTFLSIVDWRGSARFSNPHVLAEPTVWLLDLLMFIVFLILVGSIGAALVGPQARRRWQVRAVIASAVVVVTAAAVGWLKTRSAWGFPLADIVWWFDVLVIVEELVALVMAIGLGTPGCEIGVWAELLARARGDSGASESGLACLVGLHIIDSWEARRHWQ